MDFQFINRSVSLFLGTLVILSGVSANTSAQLLEPTPAPKPVIELLPISSDCNGNSCPTPIRTSITAVDTLPVTIVREVATPVRTLLSTPLLRISHRINYRREIRRFRWHR